MLKTIGGSLKTTTKLETRCSVRCRTRLRFLQQDTLHLRSTRLFADTKHAG